MHSVARSLEFQLEVGQLQVGFVDFAFTLSASESTDPDGDPLTFTWTPDPGARRHRGVRDPHGRAAYPFGAMDVTTLGSTLEAADGNGSSGAVDTTYVLSYEVLREGRFGRHRAAGDRRPRPLRPAPLPPRGRGAS